MRSFVLSALVMTLAACTGDPPNTGLDDAAEQAVTEALADGDLSLAEGPTPGAMAPDFELVDTNGETHRLADHRGETVVLEWLNYDCPYVGKHYGGENMQALQAQAEADGVVWLSVVSSAPGTQGYFEPAAMNARTQQEGGRQVAVLLDPDGTVGRAYDALTTPHMFVIDAQGRVVYNGAIDDRPTSDPASLDGATDYVTPAIAAAIAGRPADPSATQPYGCSVKYADEA